MRRIALLLAAGLAVAGCGNEGEPAAVSPEVSAAVSDLLLAVDPDVAPRFGAEGCGAWPSTPDQVITWADATLTGVTADELRAAAVTAGWQPQVAGGVDLALVGPHGVQLALTGGKVRAERARCTNGGKSRQLDADQFTRPDPTPAQTRAISDGQDTAKRVAADLDRLTGRDTPAPSLTGPVNCGDAGPQGVTWTLRRAEKLPADTDLNALLTRVRGALPPDWKAERGVSGPDQVVTATSRDDALTLTVTARKSSIKDDPSPFRFELAPTECIAVAGS